MLKGIVNDVASFSKSAWLLKHRKRAVEKGTRKACVEDGWPGRSKSGK
jgi:hypothetical protein